MSLVDEKRTLDERTEIETSSGKKLEAALKKYHELISSGTIEPRGYNLMTSQESLQSLSEYTILTSSSNKTIC